MAKKKKKAKAPSQGYGQFKCGKCGLPFQKSHGLAIHIMRTHKRRTWGTKGTSAPAMAAAPAPASKPVTARKSVSVMVCAKCGRDKFTNSMSYAAHRRFCKGSLPQVTRTLHVIPTRSPAVQMPSATAEAIRKVMGASGNGHNQIERLKAASVAKRREADEIDTLVASFEVCEANAKKFLE